MLAVGSITPPRRELAELLAEARARTVLLVSSLDDQALAFQPTPEVGSVLSELDRIVRFEQQLLPEESDQESQTSSSYDDWFDHMTEVRERVLQQLEQADLAEETAAAERYRRVLEHEYRRGESILETLQILGELYTPVEERPLPRGRRLADPGIMARFPGGTVEVGATAEVSPWPEERPSHRLAVEPFWMDVMPVSNGDFMTFMGEGGYTTRELWSEEGWQWAHELHVSMPQHWLWQDGVWWSRCMSREAPVDFTRPVCHVSWFEAEAFARFVGKRLPTEVEWEAAASWDPETQTRRRYPWGNMPPSPHVANLDQLAYGPSSAGAFPGNLSPVGCYGMIGDVWEWTASPFEGPNLVLRGGSWATRSGAIRSTTRRSARPEARHLFAGFRCARDA